jgi:hypothetical protein
MKNVDYDRDMGGNPLVIRDAWGNPGHECGSFQTSLITRRIQKVIVTIPFNAMNVVSPSV